MTPRTLRRRLVAGTASLLALAATFVLAGPAAAQEAEPAPERHAATTGATMSFAGRGWGHGRGMSQWGSQGYATQFGWTSAQILDHYYGGTRAGQASAAASRPVDGSNVRIRLLAQDAKATVVGIEGGTLALDGIGPLELPAGTTTVRLAKGADGTLTLETAPACAGPWTAVGDGRTGTTTVTVSRATGTDQLKLCRADGVTIWYPGMLRAVIDPTGVQRTVNVTTIEAQLRSVVPRESPASWDADALQSQAVAARSYALAGDSRHQPYADTCDTILCQVYMGHARQDPGGARTATTDSRTDSAIQATAGVVRLDSANRIARTEFSSTSGGWTAGGTFPAVEDKGDVISPLHTWNATVSVAPLESTYGAGGALTRIEVLSRNGLGADGGRVLQARLHFSNGRTAEVTGNQVRSSLQLRSDWWTALGRSGDATCPAAPYVDAVHQLFLDRAATATEQGRWCETVAAGNRIALTDTLSVSDEWAGVQIAGLYTKILGRTADSGGRAYWLEQVRRGLRIESIAAEFYGSREYFGDNGATNRSFVSALYDDLLGRTADAAGRDYWARLLDQGRLTRSAVAGQFYASIESRVDRVDSLFQQVLGRAPDPNGRAYWADQLRTLGDVRLAAWLGASEELYRKTTA